MPLCNHLGILIAHLICLKLADDFYWLSIAGSKIAKELAKAAARAFEELSLCPAGSNETARKHLECELSAAARLPTQAPVKRVGC